MCHILYLQEPRRKKIPVRGKFPFRVRANAHRASSDRKVQVRVKLHSKIVRCLFLPHAPHESPWKLSLATHIIKLDQSVQGTLHSDTQLFYTFTTTYLFSLETCFAKDRSWQQQNGERKTGRGISIDMSIDGANQEIHVDRKLQPNTVRTTEEIIAKIDRSTPLQIKAQETIERICDLRRLYGYVYGSPDGRDTSMDMLVPFVNKSKK